MPESVKSEPESSTLSTKTEPKKRLAPGTKLPNGKVILESHAVYRRGARLKVDPETGRVTAAPETGRERGKTK